MYTLKKSLGQHFLRDENICKKIVGILQQRSFTQLVEVGPGAGALTKYLAAIPDIRFVAIEIDEEKINYLQQTFGLTAEQLIHQSFLDAEKPFGGQFTVIGNFPYNISSQILFKILEWKDEVECVIGMFQKEVAQRIVAKEGNKVYGVLSVLVQAYFTCEYLFEVHENCFTPPPKVKSAVVRFLPRKEKIPMASERKFFVLVKTAFNQRRKTLRNAVKALFPEDALKDELFSLRAEQLSVETFAQLTYRMT